MITGLAGQSRISNNSELIRLNSGSLSSVNYFLVRSDFQNASVGWNICRLVRESKIRVAEASADFFVFPKENDRVVDCVSMTEVQGITHDRAAVRYNLGRSNLKLKG